MRQEICLRKRDDKLKYIFIACLPARLLEKTIYTQMNVCH
jgi:hypothetical protein